MAEAGEIDLRDGDRHDAAILAADHFALGDVLLEVALDATFDDLLEAEVVSFDPEYHFAS